MKKARRSVARRSRTWLPPKITYQTSRAVISAVVVTTASPPPATPSAGIGP